jgi:DNA polymerase III delta prime subunit
MVLELNASDDRGIDVVREQIKTFASTKQIFTMNPTSSSTSIAAYKLIILDEADAMTSTAQMALRRIMEKYTANTRFCIIANYTHKLSPALLSRCTRFRFSPLKERDIRVLVDKVITEENVNISPDATDALVRLSKGDMRRALNVLQACHASSKSIFFQNPAAQLITLSKVRLSTSRARPKPPRKTSNATSLPKPRSTNVSPPHTPKTSQKFSTPFSKLPTLHPASKR